MLDHQIASISHYLTISWRCITHYSPSITMLDHQFTINLPSITQPSILHQSSAHHQPLMLRSLQVKVTTGHQPPCSGRRGSQEAAAPAVWSSGGATDAQLMVNWWVIWWLIKVLLRLEWWLIEVFFCLNDGSLRADAWVMVDGWWMVTDDGCTIVVVDWWLMMFNGEYGYEW